MTTVRYISTGQIQVGSAPDQITTYGGSVGAGEGKTESVPDDVAQVLVGAGIAEVVKAPAKRTKKA